MSRIGRAIEGYLALRRALGFAQREQVPLRNFARFLERQGASHITVDLAMRWAKLSPTASQGCWATRLRRVRQLARHLSASDAMTEVPPTGLLPFTYRRKQPYIYTNVEVRALLKAAQCLPSRTGVRSATYSTLIGLLAVTGLRSSEVIALDDSDVDLADGAITIRRTKFRKSRLVTVHASTVEALRRYVRLRDKAHPRRATVAFFVGEAGRRLSHDILQSTFAKLSHQTGLRHPTDRRGPRLHDFRHRLAVNTLIRWYREGQNVEAQLPTLSTYLGHANVTDTYWYLTAVPELLRLAADRLEDR